MLSAWRLQAVKEEVEVGGRKEGGGRRRWNPIANHTSFARFVLPTKRGHPRNNPCYGTLTKEFKSLSGSFERFRIKLLLGILHDCYYYYSADSQANVDAFSHWRPLSHSALFSASFSTSSSALFSPWLGKRFWYIHKPLSLSKLRLDNQIIYSIIFYFQLKKKKNCANELSKMKKKFALNLKKNEIMKFWHFGVTLIWKIFNYAY